MAVTRGDVGFLFGLAGLLLGGAAFYQSFRTADRMDGMEGVVKSDGELIETMATQGGELRLDVNEANKRISAVRKELTDGLNDLAALRRRVDDLEAKLKDR